MPGFAVLSCTPCKVHCFLGNKGTCVLVTATAFPPSRLLSRPTALRNLLSFGMPDRDIIEGGPPKEISEAFDKFFKEKIIRTKKACAEARKEMGWAPRL